MTGAIPVEAMVVISVLIAAMVLSCLKVFGAEVEHESKMWQLRIEARRVRNERYARLIEAQQVEIARMQRLTRKPWQDATEAEPVAEVDGEENAEAALAA